MSFEIQELNVRLPSETLEAILLLAFSDLAQEERNHRVANVLSQISHDPQMMQGYFTAVEQGRILAAVASQVRSDQTLLLWPVGMIESANLSCEKQQEIRTALYERVERFAESHDVAIAVAVTEQRTSALRQEFQTLGFDYVSNMLTLFAGERSFPMDLGRNRLSFVPFQLSDFENMKEVFEQTMIETHDFPQMSGIVSTESILLNYQEQGVFHPELWFFVQVEGKNIGCLLLTDHSNVEQFELSYMGIIPEARGNRYAPQIIQYAFWLARQWKRRLITVSVDSQNEAAVHSYKKCGFRFWNRKSVFVRFAGVCEKK